MRIASVLLLLTAAGAAQAGQSPVRAARTDRPPVIDGIIRAEEWAGAVRFEDFVQLEPRRGAPATEPTLVYFLYDAATLYFAVHAYDSQPERITARLNRRDDDLSQDDSVVIVLDTFHDRRTGYFFSTNALGTQSDGRIKDDGRVIDETWDAAWLSAGRKVGDGWTAEFAIPLRVLMFQPGTNRTWGINIGRTRRSNLEATFWFGPLAGWSRLSQYGELTGLDLERGARRYELIPYVQGRYAQGRDLTGNAGLDVRYTFRPETTVNLTLNPDFAIIEADEEFVNLTRFEPRLEERRPFFLETNDRFRQRIQTFYSRRIADIDFGGKLVSRNGPWDLTLLSARSSLLPAPSTSRNPGRLAHANYTVARAERQVLKASNVALMLADRSLGGENRGSLGLDTTLHITSKINFTGQLARAHGPFGGGRWAYFARPALDTNTSHLHFRYSHVGERFGDNANAIGFIPDDDRREMDSDLMKVFWLENGPVQRVVFSSKNNIYWSQKNVLRGYHNIETAEVEFRNRWRMSATYRNEFRLFEKGFHNDQLSFDAGYNTREYQSWVVEYRHGRSFDSDLDAVGARVRRKLTSQLAAEYQLSRVWLSPDPSRQATVIHVFRVRQNFTRDLYLRAFYQTNSVIDRRNTEIVFVWRHKPPFGSIQFAFQRGRAEFGQWSDQGNTFFVKVAHVF